MLRRNLPKIILPAFLPFSFNSGDVVSKDLRTVKEADLSVLNKESGWDRVRQLFTKDDFGRLSTELHSIIQVACMSAFMGSLYGGITNSREAYIEFIKSNQATAFRNHVEAKKKLQDHVTLSFAKGAFRWGWRLTYFCTAYTTISTSVAAYRGKSGIMEHIAAGAVAGATYKLKMGPRGWIVGSAVGVALGTIAGFATLTLLRLSGMTMEEVRYWNYKWVQSRSDHFNKEHEAYLEKENEMLLANRNRNDLVESIELLKEESDK